MTASPADSNSTRLSVASIASKFNAVSVKYCTPGSKNNCSSATNTPPCGIKARELKNNKQNSKQQQLGLVNSQNKAKIGATTKAAPLKLNSEDDRPSNEYDQPWDSINLVKKDPRLLIAHVKPNRRVSCNSSSSGKNLNPNDDVITGRSQSSIGHSNTNTNDSIGSQSSTDSGVYDEPWENKQQNFSSRSFSIKSDQFSANSSKNKVAAEECCFSPSTSSSPSTSRSNSSQGTGTSNSGAVCSTNNVENMNNVIKCGTTPATTAATGSTKMKTTKDFGDKNGKNANKKLPTTTKISSIETTFCGKPSGENDRNFLRPDNTRASTSEERKARLIQRISNGCPNLEQDRQEIGSNFDHNRASAPPPVETRHTYQNLPSSSTDDVNNVGAKISSGRNIINNINTVHESNNDIQPRHNDILLKQNGIPLKQNDIPPYNQQQHFHDKSSSKTGSTGCTAEVYDVPWEFSISKQREILLSKANMDKTEKSNKKDFLPPKIAVNFGNRQNLQLNFGCNSANTGFINPGPSKIDSSLSLDKQLWYHGNITRIEAEQRLGPCKEGSYLVRCCESSQNNATAATTVKNKEYALSLKSAKGFMHMKIQLNDDNKWILGYFSYPFDSISKMIKYYTMNKLPIKGAEHMCLLSPVCDQIL